MSAPPAQRSIVEVLEAPGRVASPAPGADSGRERARGWAIWVLPAVVLLVLALAVFPAGGSDDSYITYWAARSLAETGEILNYNGDRLEQSSSLLHTLVLAAGSRLTGWSVPAVGYVVAPVGGIAAVAATVALARRVRPGTGLIAGILAATSSYLLFWSFGGLETTLATAVLAGAVIACARVAERAPTLRHVLVAVAAISATVLVRPEGGLVLGSALAGAVVVEHWRSRARPMSDGSTTPSDLRARRVGARRLGVLLGIVALVFGAAMLARLAYFGAPFPNPVAAKTGDSGASEGWGYIAKWWLSAFQVPILALAGVGAIHTLARARSAAASLVCCTLLATTGFVVFSGGDWMQGGRFLVPAVPFVAVLASSALEMVPWRRLAAVALLGIQLLGVVDLAMHRSTTTPMWADATFAPSGDLEARFAWFELRNRVHLRNAAVYVLADDVVGQLVRATDEPVTLAATQAGLTVFRLFERFEPELRFIDRHNLVTDSFGGCEQLLEPSFRGLGRKMTYEDWFPNAEACGVPLPDVVIEYFTLDDHPALVGRYTSVAAVPSLTNEASSTLRGIDVGTAQFVAVRNDLLHLLEGSTSTGP